MVDSLARVDDAFLARIGGAKGGMELIDADTMEGITRMLDNPEQAAGGSAANTTLGLARLGLPVSLLGKLGNDAGADFYRRAFAEAGGDCTRLKTGEEPNARCVSLITPDSERTMRTHLGAAMTLEPTEIEVADFSGCQHAHIEGYLLFNQGLTAKILDCAREAGCTISLDLASFEVVQAAAGILPDILRNYVDIVFANEEEAAAFCGPKITDPLEQARHLAGLCGIAAVKLGARGSIIVRDDECLEITSKPAKAIDTTGAGDLWAAGFLYGWLAGKPLRACGAYGSILGAEVVQIIGANIPAQRWTAIKAAFEQAG